jgi:hypothetical protein
MAEVTTGGSPMITVRNVQHPHRLSKARVACRPASSAGTKSSQTITSYGSIRWPLTIMSRIASMAKPIAAEPMTVPTSFQKVTRDV